MHSFAVPVNEFTAATCQYGSEFSAAIAKDNFIGCQFHPEFTSQPREGHPLFSSFINAAVEYSKVKK